MLKVRGAKLDGLILILILLAACIIFLKSTYAGSRPAVFSGSETGMVKSSTSIRFTTMDGAPDPNEIFGAVNVQRTAAGLLPLRPNAELADVATMRAQDMAARNYYAHKNPDGLYYYDYFAGKKFDKNGYSCENLDLQFTILTRQFINDWLGSSKGHRECMLADNATDAGYAVVPVHRLAGGSTAYVVVAIHAQSTR